MSILYQNKCHNGFREVPQEYADQGHGFSWNQNDDCLLYSFDICSACEAHALLHQLNVAFFTQQSHDPPPKSKLLKWMEKKIQKLFFLQDWNRKTLREEEQIHFQFCPRDRK
jgi:hypothetical protein